MNNQYLLKINISEIEAKIFELVNEHISKIEKVTPNGFFTLGDLFSNLTIEEFNSLKNNENFFHFFDLFEISPKNENKFGYMSEQICETKKLPTTVDYPQSTNQFETTLPNPKTLITDDISSLPLNINKLITRLQNVSEMPDSNFQIGKSLADVIALKNEDILKIPGVGASYVASLRQLHNLYKKFEVAGEPGSFFKENTDDFDVTSLEIVKIGMAEDELSFIETMENQKRDTSLKGILNLTHSMAKSFPLMGPAKINGFNTLQEKLLSEIKKISSGEIDIGKYESKLIRDSRIEELDIAILDKILIEDLEEFISRLDERDAEIFQCRLGFIQERCTLEELGNKYQIERERIRQIEKKCRNKFFQLMRINSERIHLSISDHLDSSLPTRMPLTSEPFESVDCFYDFLSYVAAYENLKEHVLPKSVRMGILDEYFANEGNLPFNQAEEFLDEYSKSIGTTPSNILELLIQNKKIKQIDNYLIPVTLPKKELVAYILSSHEKGLPWADVTNIANSLAVGKLLEERVDPNAFDSEYIFQCDRGTYKHIKYLKLDTSVDDIFISLNNYLSENKLNGTHLKAWHSQAEPRIRELDYYELRYVLRNYAKDFGCFFDGKSSRDNISINTNFITVTQREVILNKMNELGKPITKHEIARLLRSNSLNHASLYMSELMRDEKVVQVDFSRYTTPDIAFKNIDLNLLIEKISQIIEESELPVDSSVFEILINKQFNYFYSKYFYASIAQQKSKEKHWNVVQNKIFWDRPIPFNSLMEVSRQYLKIENSTEDNLNILLQHVQLAEKEAKNSIANWKACR